MSEMTAEVVVDEPVEIEVDEMEAIEALLSPTDENQLDGETQEKEVDVEETQKEGIDYSKEIPMPNGEHVSIGQLKDVWQQQSNIVMEVAERENAMQAEMQKLTQLAEWVEAIPQEYREQVVAMKQQELSNEHMKLLQVIPDWKDRNSYEQGRTAIYGLAEEYGMVDLVSGITDHRAIKLLNDFAKLKNSLKQAQSSIKKVEKPVAKTNIKTETNRYIKQNSDAELKAVSSLLGLK